jgi:thiamine pyrophosphokinase
MPQQTMKTLILANGEPPSAALAQRLAAEHDLILATDGAAQRAVALGITPHLICGDFDSLDRAAALRAFPEAEFVPTPDQNYADLEKAILLARARGATSIAITGAAGGRIDHTLANHALLLRYGVLLPLCIVDDRSEVWALVSGWQGRGVLSFATRPGDTVSLIAFDAGAQISISGVQWEVREFELSPGTQGVSNRASGETVTVEVQRGAVLVCHLHGFQGGKP